MTARYKILGTIHIDPLPSGAVAEHPGDSALDDVLLSLAVTDALSGARTCHDRHRGFAWPELADFNLVVHADLDVLLAELQREWEELEII